MKDLVQKLPTIYKAVAALCALLVPLITAVGAATSYGQS